MSTNEKRFNAAIQIKEDLLSAVRTMTRVIPVVKRIFELEQQLEKLEKQTKKLKGENDILKKAGNLIDDKELKEEFYKKIIHEKSITLSALYEEKRKIEEEITELNVEFDEYRKYSVELENSFYANVDLRTDELTNDEIIAYYFIKVECPENSSSENEKDPVRKRILQICYEDDGEFDIFESWLKNGMQ